MTLNPLQRFVFHRNKTLLGLEMAIATSPETPRSSETIFLCGISGPRVFVFHAKQPHMLLKADFLLYVFLYSKDDANQTLMGSHKNEPL